MSALIRQFVFVAATLLAASVAGAAEPFPQLQHNPFDRPAIEAHRSDHAPVTSRSSPGDEPFLRGVLAAGSKSVVNFGGVILRIGESAGGYRLLAVTEDGATFKKDGKKVIFSINEPEQADEQ